MSDLKIKNKKKGLNFSANNKGFYVALSICLVAIGAACVSTYGNIKTYNTPTDTSKLISSEKNSDKEANIDLKGILDKNTDTDITSDLLNDTNLSTDSSSYSDSDSSMDNSDTVSPSTDYLYPVGQRILKEFSGENLIYSKTMNDWRAHTGTDFLCEKGTKVKPLTTGIVKDIYTDDMFGTTIVIDHGNGIEAFYCGLGTTTLVTKNQNVVVGDYIGTVNTVPCECADDYHLHLEIKENGKLINPIDLLNRNN